MAIELTDDLIKLEEAALAEHAKVRAMQAEYGRPADGDGWTDDQHTAWQQQWDAWRTASEAVQAAISAHAEAAGESRYEVEKALKGKVRHPEPEEG
ncbi:MULTISPECIES: hypothetical protein [Streptomyces]|uniref:Uncharacterized protein n=2 Tax=Streptomyces rimosus subsp. rimosus TaxID=132474 RepID=L8ERB1_STRR1|nr:MULTISPECIES: hypothetical protein [Streptomyces]MYT41025.1 hypothetical protein [Streptomyces sp. SID5471]QDA03484.1 hypothetical protein CTZ40_06775 [Streptomyces rimosus]QEV74764.1 hypothetical protein CP984_06750 [Streptomyces rimosus]QGY68395.1 hypothetical protein V519_022950 [Streptomyces rimosus R6-500]QST84492.1 hypothetical protein SRIM_033835 [Streptomyces rimosus subsp. rimosus ATCC 10970]